LPGIPSRAHSYTHSVPITYSRALAPLRTFLTHLYTHHTLTGWLPSRPLRRDAPTTFLPHPSIFCTRHLPPTPPHTFPTRHWGHSGHTPLPAHTPHAAFYPIPPRGRGGRTPFTADKFVDRRQHHTARHRGGSFTRCLFHSAGGDFPLYHPHLFWCRAYATPTAHGIHLACLPTWRVSSRPPRPILVRTRTAHRCACTAGAAPRRAATHLHRRTLATWAAGHRWLARTTCLGQAPFCSLAYLYHPLPSPENHAYLACVERPRRHLVSGAL